MNWVKFKLVRVQARWENVLRDRSGLVNRPLVAQTISANEDMANVKPSPVLFDMSYTSLEKNRTSTLYN